MLYSKMVPIELAREQSDLLYHLFVNTNTSTLDDICNKIATILKAKYNDEMSIRLQNMIKRSTQTQDRVAKHGFLLFALYQEPEIRTFFMGNGDKESPRVPPEKFRHFVEHELPQCSEKLLKGALTSLRAFVEDARWNYCIL